MGFRMVVAPDLESISTTVRQDYQDKVSDVKVRQVVLQKGLQDMGYEHGVSDEWRTASPRPCYPRNTLESR